MDLTSVNCTIYLPQGAYHFSPFAVPHQNGITEASVSSYLYVCLLLVKNICRHLQRVIYWVENDTCPLQGNTTANADAHGKPHEGKEKLPIKRSKGSLGSLKMITGKSDEEGKTTGPSANGASSKRYTGTQQGIVCVFLVAAFACFMLYATKFC